MGGILKGMLMNLNESEGEPPEVRGTKTVVHEKWETEEVSPVIRTTYFLDKSV